MTQRDSGPGEAASTSSWIDDGELDAGWPAPESAQDAGPRRRRRRVLGVSVPILVVVLVIGTVWALGGFGYRDDKVTDVAVGQTFTTGPYEFKFTQATVQQNTDYTKKVTHEVLVTGTIRNTWTEAVTPEDNWFLASNRGSDPIGADSTDFVRPDDAPWDTPTRATPGLPAQPYQISFEFGKDMNPGKTIKLGVGKLSYGNPSIFSTSTEKTWDADNGELYRLQIPMKVLKPKKGY